MKHINPTRSYRKIKHYAIDDKKDYSWNPYCENKANNMHSIYYKQNKYAQCICFLFVNLTLEYNEKNN